MPPKDFIQARATNQPTLVDDRPYFPNLAVTLTSDELVDETVEQSSSSSRFNNSSYNNSSSNLLHSYSSILTAALAIIFYDSKPPDNIAQTLNVKTITGGITNALYCITGFKPIMPYDQILIRIFGAEGMIDRDVETSTFAHLAIADIAPHYYGRFANGRLEGYLEQFSPLVVMDLQIKSNMEAIAKQMARLHSGFQVPNELEEFHIPNQPGLWDQLHLWMKHAAAIDPELGYKSKGDSDRAKRLLNLTFVQQQLTWVEEEVIPQDSTIAFCHNDLLPANIMKHTETGEVRLIDFEYGGVNFVAFDIANHFNEFAGGPEKMSGEPDYSLFPDENEQKLFITAYCKECRLLSNGHDSNDEHSNEHGNDDDNEKDVQEEVAKFSKEVLAFVLANHLYWGLWAVNQAATEGTEKFDYLAYAWHRFNRYTEVKVELGY
jgi:ethanolamine kinase